MFSALSRSRRKRYKADRRQREFELIVSSLRKHLGHRGGRLVILEFGCGPAGGAYLLKPLGTLVETDVYRHPDTCLPQGVPFVMCSISSAPFVGSAFDILLSNQVIEHLPDLRLAFDEMGRVAKPDALFVFGVPTAVWLLLTVPGQLWKKMENVFARVFGRSSRQASLPVAGAPQADRSHAGGRPARLALAGHGCYPGFMECLWTFQVRRWRELFLSHGFQILSEEPLLCYGSSHFPIVPTNRLLARIGLASSYLFVLRKVSGK